MKIVLPVMSLIIALFCLSCKKSEVKTDVQDTQPIQQTHSPSGVSSGVVKEVIQGNSYTYLKVENADTVDWVATGKCQLDVGARIAFSKNLPMNNFTSKELQRTFDTIYFAGKVDRLDETASSGQAQVSEQPHQKPAVQAKDISIEPLEDGVSIAKLFSNKTSYANKIVRIRGQVTKVNLSIMGKNWIHLQDGTGEAGSNDLLVTTQEVAEVGDVVIFEGRIVLNKDFGSGYSYAVLMEEAKRLTE